MHTPHGTSKKQQAVRSIHLMMSVHWLILIGSFIILVSTGALASNYRPLGANSVATIDLLQAYNEVGQTEAKRNLAASADKLANTPSLWPVNGAITSGFGWRTPPIEDGSALHQGVDIAVEISTPVVATADGEVIKSGWAGGYGNLVQINHGNGIETLYGHNSQLAVGVGQKVKKGQVISYVGSTGVSTGPHIHYEVQVNGTAVNPMKFMVQY